MRFGAVLQNITVSCMVAVLFISASVSLCAQPTDNQAAADKIAEMINDRFPTADIYIHYQSGQVSLSGDVPSSDMRRQIAEAVFGMQNVTGIKNEMQVVAPPLPRQQQTQERTSPSIGAVTPPIPIPATRQPTQTPLSAAPPAAIAPVPIPPAPAADLARETSPRTPAREALDSLRPTANAGAAAPVPPGTLPNPGAVPPPVGAVNPYAGRYAHPPAYNYNAPNAAMPAGSYMRQPTPSGTFAPRPAYVTPNPPPYPNGALPGGVLPGQYNQPTLPEHAWPAYAAYPNYAQVSYPRVYSPKAWPYIGPFYPYPQVPMGWRKVTLENHDGWWWLDFDDGPNTGPFSPLFRQPQRYTY